MAKTIKQSVVFLSTSILITVVLVGCVSLERSLNPLFSNESVVTESAYDLDNSQQIDEIPTRTGAGMIHIRTFAKSIQTTSKECATYTKTFKEFSESSTALQARAYGNFCWNEINDTIEVTKPVGKIQHLSSRWHVKKESIEVRVGGGTFTRKWAAVIFRFRRYNTVGLAVTRTVTIKIDSSGKRLNAD